MSWINSKQFTITNRNGRHYVFRRNSAGNTEINIPSTVTTKGQAIAWLKAHPNKVANPSRYKAKRGAVKPYERIINGKKMNAFVNKEGREYFKPALGPEPGYVANSRGVPRRFTCDVLKKTLKNMDVIGRGRQGIVFKASRHSNGRHPFAIKISPRDLKAASRKEIQPAEAEYKIQKAAMDAAPSGVVAIEQLIECKDFVAPLKINMENVANDRHFDKSRQMVIIMEYCKGGSLRKWLGEKGKSDAVLHHVITSIVGTLVAIHKKYPEFRHNDLHLENIFVADRGFLLGDFGWARLYKTGTNPAVNTANGTDTSGKWGVGSKTDPRYDIHLFLNELREWVVKKGGLPATRAFLDVAVPSGYRGASSTHTSEYRLKYEDPCPGLPSLAEIARSKYVTGRKVPARITSMNLVTARARLKKPARAVTSAKLAEAKARLRKVRKSPVKPKRLVTSLNLRAAREKLKAARPLKKVTVDQLKAAKARLRRGRVVKALPAKVYKDPRFDKLVENLWRNSGSSSNANFTEAWNKARNRAIRVIELRINGGNAPFSPRVSVRKPVRKPEPKPEPKPERFKIPAPNSGRMVYANGATISLQYLKNMAASRGIQIKGLRSKANIARKIFGR